MNNSDGANRSTNGVVQLESQSELDTFVSKARLVVVEFYTDGCGICQSMEPVIGNLVRELDISIGTVNPRDDPPLVDRFDVRSVPLFVLFDDGDPVARLADGFVGGDDLTNWVEKHTE